MSRRLASWLPAAGLIAVLGLLLAQIPLVIASHDSLEGVWGSMALALPFAVVGAVVARRQPRNPVGWLLMGVIVTYAVSGDAVGYEVLVYRQGHSGWPLGPVSIVLEPIWIGLIVLPPVAILLFPDGHLPSRRWRWMLATYIAIETVCATVTLGVALVATINGSARVTANGDLTVIAATDGWFHGVQSLGLLTAGLSAVVWIGMQVVRWRRASGELRQQLKWLMSGAAICVGTLALLLTGPVNNSATAWNLMGPVGIAALPASIGVGILRYRLYEIDVLVRKTLVYSALVAVLAVLYLGGILVLGRGLERITGQSGALAVTVSTLAVAAGFQPLRQRIQRFVDRRFYRSKYDAADTLEEFTTRLRDQIDLAALQTEVLDVVRATVQPKHVSLWLRPGASEAPDR